MNNIWKANKAGEIWVTGKGLTSLHGAPRIVYGDFVCMRNDIESLEGGPEIVYGQYQCTDNRITNLHNIHHHIKEIHGLFCFGSQPKVKVGPGDDFKIVTHLLGLVFIKDLTGIRCHGPINDIFDEYRHDVLLFQDALIDAGFEEQAKF